MLETIQSRRGSDMGGHVNREFAGIHVPWYANIGQHYVRLEEEVLQWT